jgi:hypothetical protein
MIESCYYLELLFSLYPKINFEESDVFSWYSPKNRICFVGCLKNCSNNDNPCSNFYKLAHELGHAILNHQDYKTKIELNRIELAAWEEAEKIVKSLNLKSIPEDVIDLAMNSYVNNANLDECPNCELSLIGGHCPNCQ